MSYYKIVIYNLWITLFIWNLEWIFEALAYIHVLAHAAGIQSDNYYVLAESMIFFIKAIIHIFIMSINELSNLSFNIQL